MPANELNWVVVRGFDIGPRSECEAERFTRNIPNAYALKFSSETEAYRYWEYYYSKVAKREPEGWKHSHLLLNLKLHPIPNNLSNATAIGTFERTFDTAGPAVRRAGPEPLPSITPTPTLSHGLSFPGSSSTSSTSGESTFTLEPPGPRLSPAARRSDSLGLQVNTQTSYNDVPISAERTAHAKPAKAARSQHSLESEISTQIPVNPYPPAITTSAPSTPSTDYGLSTPNTDMLDALLDIQHEYYAVQRLGAAPGRELKSAAQGQGGGSHAQSGAQSFKPAATVGPQERAPSQRDGFDSHEVAGRDAASTSVPTQQTQSHDAFRPAFRDARTHSAIAPPLRSDAPASHTASPSCAQTFQRESASARWDVQMRTPQHERGQSRPAQASSRQHASASRSAMGSFSIPNSRALATESAGARHTEAAHSLTSVDVRTQRVQRPASLVWGWHWQLRADDSWYMYADTDLRRLPANFGGHIPQFEGAIPVPPPGPWSDKLAEATFYIVIRGRAPGIYNELRDAKIRFSDPGWFTLMGWPAAYAAFKDLDNRGSVKRST